jgi:hypothetical protein
MEVEGGRHASRRILAPPRRARLLEHWAQRAARLTVPSPRPPLMGAHTAPTPSRGIGWIPSRLFEHVCVSIGKLPDGWLVQLVDAQLGVLDVAGVRAPRHHLTKGRERDIGRG